MTQEEKKPREFWISPKLYSPADPVEAEYFVAYDLPGDPKRLEIHAIEYSAYEQLKAELDQCKIDQIQFLTEHPTYRLSKELEAENEDLKAKLEKAVEALRFYAESRNWREKETYDGTVGPIIDDSDEFFCDIRAMWVGGKRAQATLKEIKGEL